jgi:hypothetical protein
MCHGNSIQKDNGVEVTMASSSLAWIDPGVLTDLAVRSKAHWGYDNAFLHQCQEELAVSPESIESGNVYVAKLRNNEGTTTVAGFFVLDKLSTCGDKVVFDLDALFVEPTRIGQGIGQALSMKQA